MSNRWKPSIRIWPFKEAPEEFKRLSRCGGGEELVIYVPHELLDGNGETNLTAPALWFLDWPLKFPSQEKYAGEEWGWYAVTELPNGGQVFITTGSGEG